MFAKAAVLGLAAASVVQASPAPPHQVLTTLAERAGIVDETCEKINYRKSWNALTDAEKKEYIDAELCLMTHEPITGLVENATNIWDEFANAHVSQGNDIHYVGQFLPWHRYYVRTHEIVLQKICNYTGAHPYWDELTDYVNGGLTNSSIFDPITGFGGNGTGNNSCVQDGPFANLTLHISNHHQRGDEFCLSRALDEDSFAEIASANIEECFGYENYTDAWQCYNGYPHGSGHGGVGGLMLDPIDSCNDPLFFMHHANLDKLWWEWQLADYPHRLFDMGGNNTASQTILDMAELSQPGADILDYDGDNGNTTTLNHTLWMNSITPNVTVGDIMQLNGSVICAQYVVAEGAALYNTSVHTSGNYQSLF